MFKELLKHFYSKPIIVKELLIKLFGEFEKETENIKEYATNKV